MEKTIPGVNKQPDKFPFELDPVIEYYKQRINRAELEENLKLTPEERILKMMRRQQEAEQLEPATQQSDQPNLTS